MHSKSTQGALNIPFLVVSHVCSFTSPWQARNQPFYDLVRGSMAEPALAFVAAGGAAHEAEATEAFERWLRQFHSEREPWAGGVAGKALEKLGESWSFWRVVSHVSHWY